MTVEARLAGLGYFLDRSGLGLLEGTRTESCYHFPRYSSVQPCGRNFTLVLGS